MTNQNPLATSPEKPGVSTDSEPRYISEEELAEMERLRAEATPGPWVVLAWNEDGSEVDQVVQAVGDESILTTDSNVYTSDADAHYIAAMENAVPKLIAEIRRLRGYAPPRLRVAGYGQQTVNILSTTPTSGRYSTHPFCAH